MQIAPIGALEAALASLATSMPAQQQIAQANVGQNGNRATVVDEMSEADMAQASKATADATDKVSLHQEQVAQSAVSSGSNQVEAGQSMTQRRLFDYLAEVEKSGGTSGMPPSALIQSGLGALDGTLQSAAEAMSKAKDSKTFSLSQDIQNASPGSKNQTGAEALVQQVEHLTERAMNMMWATSKIHLVMSSVQAATASTNTLIKQQ